MKKNYSSLPPYLLAVFAICFWLVLFHAPLLYAQQVNYVPLAPIDTVGSEFTSKTFDANSSCVAPTCFPRYLKTIYNVGIALAGFFAVFSIVRGGFELMWTDSILGHAEAKGIILRAIGGLIVVYSSYILMNAINPQLARDLSLSFETLPPPQAAFGNLPPNLPPETNDTATLRSMARGYISENVNNRIQELAAKAKTSVLTQEEEQEQKELEIVRQGVVALNRIYATQANVNNGLKKFGLTSSLAREARGRIEQLRLETNARIRGMEAEGASVKQMAVVRSQFNKVVEDTEKCIGYLGGNTKDQFNSYCQ